MIGWLLLCVCYGGWLLKSAKLYNGHMIQLHPLVSERLYQTRRDVETWRHDDTVWLVEANSTDKCPFPRRRKNLKLAYRRRTQELFIKIPTKQKRKQASKKKNEQANKQTTRRAREGSSGESIHSFLVRVSVVHEILSTAATKRGGRTD